MRGETFKWENLPITIDISIHSPHARGDGTTAFTVTEVSDFNPLPSCEGRRQNFRNSIPGIKISIHSPHARGDAAHSIIILAHEDFNPLPSCEGRQLVAVLY